MKYTIISVSRVDDTIQCVVDYDFDGVKSEIVVPIFQPRTVDEVISGIESMALTMNAKIEASEVMKGIPIGIETEIKG